MRPPRQKVWLAFLGSVLLHGIALLLFALIVALRPPAPPVPAPEEPMKLEMVQEEPPDTPPPLPDAEATPTPTPKPKLVVDAAGLDADSSPPADAPLSDRSTRASSSVQNENGPLGTTQTGHKMASFQFDPRPPAAGALSRTDPPAPTPPPETAPELPKPDRSATRPPSTPPPVATPPPLATPAPSTARDEFAMAMATPPPTPEDPFDPSIRSTSPPLPKPVTRPADRSTPPPVGAMRSAENGSAPLGPGGIDTVATPAGRYTRKVADMIKFIWYRSIESRDDVMYGSVVIHCTIDRDGLVIEPRVATNTADPMFASTALQAVVVARLPAMPDEVVKELEGKRLPMNITFERAPMPQGSGAH